MYIKSHYGTNYSAPFVFRLTYSMSWKLSYPLTEFFCFCKIIKEILISDQYQPSKHKKLLSNSDLMIY